MDTVIIEIFSDVLSEEMDVDFFIFGTETKSSIYYNIDQAAIAILTERLQRPIDIIGRTITFSLMSHNLLYK